MQYSKTLFGFLGISASLSNGVAQAAVSGSDTKVFGLFNVGFSNSINVNTDDILDFAKTKLEGALPAGAKPIEELAFQGLKSLVKSIA